MGRLWREEYNGGIYHVIARGNNKEYIFKESIDKGYFIKLLKESMKGMSFRIYGYVLMDNHYHLIVQVFNKKLQEIMHQINNKYSKYFNFKFKRVGHVFQGRYKAILVQDERYLLSLLRYVHQNPIKAGMCKNIEEYKWCSDVFYRTSNDSFINIDTVLDMLSVDRKDAISKYREYMRQIEQTDYENVRVVGEEAYQIMCSTKKKVEQKKRLDEILIGLGLSGEIYELIKNGSRRRDLTVYKINYFKEAIKLNYTQEEMGRNIGISESAVRNMISRSE
ncbi:MAG TPA: transposase [Patescibacteria group bacterium]|nr:transposase [Patescibacteria group bacterium]